MWKCSFCPTFKYMYFRLKKKEFEKHCSSDLCNTFSLSNLIQVVKCIKSSVDSSIDVIQTNRPRSFHHTSLIETGKSNCSKFSVEVSVHKLDQELDKGIIYNSQDKQYDLFSETFRTVLDHHAPLNTKRIAVSILRQQEQKNYRFS